MGLFHKTLDEISKAVSRKDFNNASLILKRHIEAEHHLNSDLAGLARAILIYKGHLGDLGQKLHAVSRSEGVGEKTQVKEINELIASAKEQVRDIQSIIAALRKEARIDLP